MLDQVPTHSFSLTRNEIALFHSRGFLGPFNLCSPLQMAHIREELEGMVFSSGTELRRFYARHLDCKLVYDICSHPAIIDRIENLYGSDLMLWNSGFWIKEPNDPAVPWHQDCEYWEMEPQLNVTAWVAITDATKENGCARLVGEHHVLPHVPTVESEGFLFDKKVNLEQARSKNAFLMELKAGQFFIFNERALHCSYPNITSRRRIGLTARISVPFVKIFEGTYFPADQSILMLRGNNRWGFNRVGVAPT